VSAPELSPPKKLFQRKPVCQRKRAIFIHFGGKKMNRPMRIEYRKQKLCHLVDTIRKTKSGVRIEELRVIDLGECSKSDCGNGIYIFYSDALKPREFLYVGLAGSESFGQRISVHLDRREGKDRTMSGILTTIAEREQITKGNALRYLIKDKKAKLLLLTFPESALKQAKLKKGKGHRRILNPIIHELEKFLISELVIRYSGYNRRFPSKVMPKVKLEKSLNTLLISSSN
jgi:hypothetical protein